MRIAKDFHWEMGHRLPYHKGKCINLHGHSYKAIIEIDGVVDKNGLVIDFYDLKKVVNPVIEKLDHAFMVYDQDKELLRLLKKFNTKICVVPFHSTVENITSYLLDEIKKKIKKQNIYGLTVTVYETADSYASDTTSVGMPF
ncbi:MAG: 6-carboxytetrahydropterin synthase [Ignavibacteriaceae bacterium]|nr:6-carboxytetrahydropterin synthase [Ignavibacteriaceae bacterium]